MTTDKVHVYKPPKRKSPKFVFIKKVLFKLHLRNSYPLKLTDNIWGTIMRVNSTSSEVRPDTFKEERS